MEFKIFDSSEVFLYVRDDAQEAIHYEVEYRLSCTFPLTDKFLERGMLIGFTDIEDVFQLFEIREVVNSDPDQTQEIQCEHIFMADLLDDVVEDINLTGVTADAALEAMLAYTRWLPGTYIATATGDAPAYYVSAWSAACSIRDTWSVRIKPRVILTGTAITARYADIASATPVNRDVRLEINKNIEQLGVTYDDKALYTALYGRGKSLSTVDETDTNDAKLTFEDAVWVYPAYPANKPVGQKWVEDVAATALYGRNGRRRTGVVEFPDIEDAGELLLATWNALQTVNAPKVTVDCTVMDLYAYGYSDELMLLGDEVTVIDDALGVELKATVIKMQRDLLRPEQTQPTIGSYRSGLDALVSSALSAANTVQRMTNSNPDLVNGFSTNVNGAVGTFQEIVQANPTNPWQKITIGEKLVDGDVQAGILWGNGYGIRVVVDSYGVLHLYGDAGITIETTQPGAPVSIIAAGLYLNGNPIT